jgi:hypothetical protein
MRFKRLRESSRGEPILYRGVGSNLHSTNTYSGGRFYADNPMDASQYGDTVQVVKLNRGASIFNGCSSSYSFCKNNNLMDNNYSILREITNGKYSTLRDFDENYLDDGSDNLTYRAYQCIARQELSNAGYDGAEWTYEDDLIPHQYQIWNSDVITICGTLKSVWKDGKETFISEKLEEEFVMSPEVGKPYYFSHSDTVRHGTYIGSTKAWHIFEDDSEHRWHVPKWASIATTKSDLGILDDVVNRIEKDTHVPDVVHLPNRFTR